MTNDAAFHPVVFTDRLPAAGAYRLGEVILERPGDGTFIVRAKLHGPPGSAVWARAWVSTEHDGTLAETASGQLLAGDQVRLAIKLKDDRQPDFVYARIESAPLQTEHVVGAALR
jgi:hypothetical protein